MYGNKKVERQFAAWLDAIGGKKRANLERLYYEPQFFLSNALMNLADVLEIEDWVVQYGEKEPNDFMTFSSGRIPGETWDRTQRLVVVNK